MTTSKTAFVSLLIACWIAGLVNQFHAWDATARYLLLSLLIVAVVALKGEYKRQYAKSRIRRDH